jgi:catechol 2,3-dioxygenase-like lactoylglutathione lyase family enzyme
MEPRLSLLTLGVTDLKRAVAFYRDGLGWPISSASTDEVAFLQLAGGVALALYPRTQLAQDVGLEPGQAGGVGMTLAHNVPAAGQVDEILAQAQALGAQVLKSGHDTSWGGRVGYFADPEGFVWEVAWNPGFPMDEDGGIQLP